MRIGARRMNAAIGFVAALLTAAATATTAYATPASASPTGNGPVTVKSGAHGVMTVKSASGGEATTLAAPAPTTSPSAESRTFIPSGGSFSCASGRACAGVPYSGGTYLFKFFNYGGYSLSNWFDTGFVVNHQTGGAAFRIDDIDGHLVRCFAPRSDPYNGVNWNPIWRVRLTANGC